MPGTQPERDFASRSRSADSQPPEEAHSASDAGVAGTTRARDYTAEIINFPRSLAADVASSAPAEADRPGLPRPRFRSPLTEDQASPRCMLAYHAERARAYGGGSLLVTSVYWVLTTPVLAASLAGWLIRFATETTGRGWLIFALSIALVIAVH